MINEIKLGFIGLGQRGNGLLSTVLDLDCFNDIKITAVCDSYEDRTNDAAKRIYESRGEMPAVYTDYTQLLKDKNVNTVIISAAWEAHVPIAVAAIKAGKVCGLEVGGAYSVHDCWELVKTYEATKTPFMFLENCCYGEKELFVSNLARNGLLGEIVYCHGSYCHDLRSEICGGVKNRHYRLRNYLERNCDNYPTHELGPIARLLNINRGNRMVSLVSMSSKARGLSEFVKGKQEYEFLQGKHFNQGDVVETLITCADGTLISLKLDTSLPRAYSREYSVSGTKGVYQEMGNILLFDNEASEDSGMGDYIGTANKYEEKYGSILWKNITEKEISAGHGGMDTLELKAFFNAIKTDDEMPIDVYDAASWMVITALSEESIAKGGAPVSIPDFTGGQWVMREPKDVSNG